MSNMSSSHHHPQAKGGTNHSSLRHNNKKRLNQNQVRVLEANFTSTKKLDPERKLQLARQLGVPPRQVAIWYQNKRARWKNQSLELDYSALQLRLETALDEKRHLEREVAQLQAELQRTRDTLFASSSSSSQAITQTPRDHHQLLQPFSSGFSSCNGGDEGGGSSCSWQNNGAGGGHGGQLDELYAWLMGSEGSTAIRGQHEKAFHVSINYA